jgi:hypothetical protein
MPAGISSGSGADESVTLNVEFPKIFVIPTAQASGPYGESFTLIASYIPGFTFFVFCGGGGAVQI